MRKMGDSEVGCQRTLTPNKGLEASRATKLLSKSSAHRGVGESVSRFIGVSAHLLVGIAICIDFVREMGDFVAAPQGKLTPGKRLEASRATKFLSKSSAHRCIGSSLSWLGDL